jgi:predicted dehydrogenase
MVAHFARCVRGLVHPAYDVGEAVATLAILDALARAAQTGRAERPTQTGQA